MYARVIVDIPVKEANRPFDYRIPSEWVGLVEIGSRVGVPFGPRVIQGYVVEISEHTEINTNKVKSIKELLDAEPPLLPEMVELGKWMSERYLCHWVTALHGMIPAALKGKEEKRVHFQPYIWQRYVDSPERWTSIEVAMIEWVKERKGVTIEALLKTFPGQTQILKRLLSLSLLEETRRVVDQVGMKKSTYVSSPLSAVQLQNEMDNLSSKAKRQKELIQYFIENESVKPKLSELLTELQISRSTIASLVEKGVFVLEELEEYRDPFAHRSFQSTPPLPLTPEQQHAFIPIVESLDKHESDTFLLHGVTGSGKTEVYLQAIAHCLSQGREAIVLVPEISLTPQMVERFKGRFGDRVAVLHSRLSAGERYDEWRKIYRKEADVAVGARSAMFAPLTNIGLIIIDEEHESSYKQEDHPKYHARDIAIERAINHQAVVLLGSATPSLESYARARSGKMKLLEMKERITGSTLPKVQVIDMRHELKEGHRSMFSRTLIEGIRQRLDRNEQMVLFLNRRGFSTFVLCRSCGHVVECPHCDISLTYHQNNRTMRCHYCGYSTLEPKTCPSCKSEHIRFFGTGTQKVEQELTQLFPGIRVIRMDVDTTTEKGAHEKWLTMFGRRQADVLLGTQMVAKGLDFPYVTLVGVIAADTILNLPDFRAAERTYQLLTQVAGRAGRHHLAGEVMIQTYTPEHYSVQFASNQQFEPFFTHEMSLRKVHKYPPYCRLALLTLSHENVPLIVKAGEALAGHLKRNGDPGKVQVFGPVPSPIGRIKDRYRYQCMVKFIGGFPISMLIDGALNEVEDYIKNDKLQVSVDIDPNVLM
jgi:primosomal protein N' (replication factor Y)